MIKRDKPAWKLVCETLTQWRKLLGKKSAAYKLGVNTA